MATAYTHYLLAITTDEEIGNAIAAALDANTEGHLTFTKGAKLRVAGTQSTTPTAWYAAMPVTAAVYAVAQEFADGGYPQPLLDAGVAQAMLDAARTAITFQAGERAGLEGTGLPFIAANGYEIIPAADVPA